MTRAITFVVTLCLSAAVSACAMEPQISDTASPPKATAQPAKGKDRPGAPRLAAMMESLNGALVRAEDSFKAGTMDATAYERVLRDHQRTIATIAAIQALGWGDYPPPMPPGSVTPRPPTRVEAIERLMEMLNRPEDAAAPAAKPRTSPRK
ncbi:hypothetical protein CU669_13300 [Paramagnetospirillum kuznetsovii]|uniref:DUF305 domain-containing protein n=1 Tax=Paramagnetospirillum kuznetsovii TaxID=2053833 RepID=A0A364NWI3_9PROT|nr:hypothetical protein [Paramagnetospirillum kuznetsovii]RAU21403.1 hypothetical protein CU669_13300 [Paramagnetospirillum kuznetsovii]